MPEIKEIEVFVILDENGEYAVATEEGNLSDAYDSDVGGGSDIARRIICVKLKAPVPEKHILTLSASVPREAEPVAVK